MGLGTLNSIAMIIVLEYKNIIIAFLFPIQSDKDIFGNASRCVPVLTYNSTCTAIHTHTHPTRWDPLQSPLIYNILLSSSLKA